MVESIPSGAEVKLNGVQIGTTPIRVNFRHYGVYEVELRKEGWNTLSEKTWVSAPFYARFPVCIFAEFLWPGRIKDERRLSYSLAPSHMPEKASLLKAAADELDSRDSR